MSFVVKLFYWVLGLLLFAAFGRQIEAAVIAWRLAA